MQHLNHLETELFPSVDIDPRLVGPVLSDGSQNRVRWLEGNTSPQEFVVKTRIKDVCTWVRNPLLRSINTFTCQTATQAIGEYEQCGEYFEKPVLETDMRIPRGNPESLVMVQKAIRYKKLTLAIVRENAEVRRQFSDILDRNGVMLKETGQWLDVAGMNVWNIKDLLLFGIPFSDNIVIDEETGDLQIIDTGIYPANQAFGQAIKIQRKNANAYGMNFEGTIKESAPIEMLKQKD